MSKVTREGKIILGDASMSIWEEGLGGSNQERDAWEELFRKQVFSKMVWFLRKLGWTTEIDADDFADTKARHGLKFAQQWCSRKRLCSHGDLKGEIDVTGRCIDFKMWQGVNTPTRPDHGGKYESNKEAVMPYLLRLRMERTRRRMCEYLTHVIDGYVVEDKSPKARYVGPGGMTAMQAIADAMRSSCHYRPELGRASFSMDRNNLSGDKQRLENGMKVYAREWSGRIICGTAYYNLNDQWWLETGRYGYRSVSAYEIYVNTPDDLRMKRNERLRRDRLEGELAKAIKAMNFKRAEVIKNILFPPNTQLYVVKHPEGKYHCSNFSGYTNNVIDAGKFTMEEAKRYAQDNELIPLQEVV